MTADHPLEHSLRILDRLNVPDWREPLIWLDHRMHLIPAEPTWREELLAALVKIEYAYQQDREIPLAMIAPIYLCRLDVFCWRFIVRGSDQQRQYLNPLDPTTSFNQPMQIEQAGSPYPAQDIIARWFRDHLK